MIGASIDGHVSAEGVDAVEEAAQPTSPVPIRIESDTGIGHLYEELASVDIKPDVDIMRIRVFKHVGKRLGDKEVGGSLDIV